MYSALSNLFGRVVSSCLYKNIEAKDTMHVFEFNMGSLTDNSTDEECILKKLQVPNIHKRNIIAAAQAWQQRQQARRISVRTDVTA